MRRTALEGLDLNEEGFPLLLHEFDHRIRNLRHVMEATIRQTQSSNVEDYRAKLIEPILSLRRLYKEKGSSYALRELKGLIEHTVGLHCANGARIVASGPTVELEPNLALAVHLVFHELALNAKKYGALRSRSGFVEIIWTIRDVPGASRKLEVLWSEHGGPRVKRPAHSGFGLRLIKKSVEGHGDVRLQFIPAGLSCFMILDLGRASKTRSNSVHARHPSIVANATGG
ncbi:MAG: sensor histidine kinase [Rhodomicrobium sp.]